MRPPISMRAALIAKLGLDLAETEGQVAALEESPVGQVGPTQHSTRATRGVRHAGDESGYRGGFFDREPHDVLEMPCVPHRTRFPAPR